MTALFVIELSVKDPDALKEYGAQTPPLLEKFGGTLLMKGKPELVFETNAGDVKYGMLVIFQFPTKEQAEGWYACDEYQALIPVRDKAMDCTFRILA